MPRTSTGGEDSLLAATYRRTWTRVQIADPDDAMQDMASYASYGWMVSAAIDEALDQPLAGATVKLRREINLVGGLGDTSLSPLRTDSPANPDGAAVTVNRLIWIDVAVVAGGRPSALSTDWKRKFVGTIDRVSDISSDSMTVTARDRGANLQDQYVEAVGNAVPKGPMSLEAVVNVLLRQSLKGAPFDATTLPVGIEPVY
jgi:hypothetical protein